MCSHTLWDLPGLVCDRTEPHDSGHTYHSTKPDEHADGGDQ